MKGFKKSNNARMAAGILPNTKVGKVLQYLLSWQILPGLYEVGRR